MRNVLVIAVGLVSFGLSVQVAIAERPRGTNCIAGYKKCKDDAKGSSVAINACVGTFNRCVSDNKDQHYNPYGYPTRIGDSPAVLKDVPGISIGKAGVTAGAKAINPGAAATMTTNIGTLGAPTVNPGTAATTTTTAAPVSTPPKPSTTISSGVPAHATVVQPGRSNFRVQ